MIAGKKSFAIFIRPLNQLSFITLGTSDCRFVLLLNLFNVVAIWEVGATDEHAIAAFFDSQRTSALGT